MCAAPKCSPSPKFSLTYVAPNMYQNLARTYVAPNMGTCLGLHLGQATFRARATFRCRTLGFSHQWWVSIVLNYKMLIHLLQLFS